MPQLPARRSLWLLAVTLGALVLTTGVATAATTTELPYVTSGNVLLDPAHGHVLISGESSPNGVAVLNTDGTLDTTIPNESGGLLLSPDGSTIYVQQCRGGTDIDEFDAATLAPTGTISPGNGLTTNVCNFAIQNSRIWYSDGNGNAQSAPLSNPQMTAGIPEPFGGHEFHSVPGHADWMIDVLADQKVLLLDITDPANVTELASRTFAGGINDIAVSATGSFVVVATNTTSQALSLPTLAPGATFLNAQTDGVAIAPAGGRVVATHSDLTKSYLTEYNATTGAVLASWSWATKTSLEYARGVSFSSNGAFIYDATQSGAHVTGTAVHTAQSTPLTSTQFSFKPSKASVAAGAAVTLTAHFGFATTNRAVSIYRQAAGTTTPVLIASGTTGTGGNYSVVDHPAANTTYSMRWSGDATHLPLDPSSVVKVIPVMHRVTTGGYATSSGVRLYHYAASCTKPARVGCPSFQAWTTPLQPKVKISYVIDRKSAAGTWLLFKHGSAYAGTGGKATFAMGYKNTSQIGVNQRIRFSIVATAKTLGGTSGWLNYRVTN